MANIKELIQYLGEPYDIECFDGEDCIHRKFQNFEFEVSKTNQNRCILYVWTILPRRVVAIYENIPTENLKDFLGYYAVIYQNLLAQIRVEREEIEV